MTEPHSHSASLAEYSSPTAEQLQARWRFVKNVYNASLYLFLLASFVLLISVFLNLIMGKSDWFTYGLTAIVFIAALAIVYDLTLVTVIWKRTGLKWYLAGENLGMFNLLPILVAYIFFFAILPSELRSPMIAMPIVIAVFALFWWPFRRLFAPGVTRQLIAERSRYAQHWLVLGQLSFADVLFLRIPTIKERAL